MKPNQSAKASEYISEILEELEVILADTEWNPEFSDTVPGRKQHIIEGTKKILELYGEVIDRPVHDPNGNIRYEYAMGTIHSSLDSYKGTWNFGDEEIRSLHRAYRYLFLKSDLSIEEVGYSPEEYQRVDEKEEHLEGFLKLVEDFWENRDYLAESLEKSSPVSSEDPLNP